LGDLPLKILIEDFFAAEKVGALMMVSERLDTWRVCRSGHL
jgi:hypothetical protein